MYFLFLKPSPERAIRDSVPSIIRAATREKPVFGVSNQVRHPQEKARIWKVKEEMYLTIRLAKTKALISCAVTAQLICVFLFA